MKYNFVAPLIYGDQKSSYQNLLGIYKEFSIH